MVLGQGVAEVDAIHVEIVADQPVRGFRVVVVPEGVGQLDVQPVDRAEADEGVEGLPVPSGFVVALEVEARDVGDVGVVEGPVALGVDVGDAHGEPVQGPTVDRDLERALVGLVLFAVQGRVVPADAVEGIADLQGRRFGRRATDRSPKRRDRANE